METIINLGIPPVGEQIFESINTEDLLQFLEVSETWKVLAKNVLMIANDNGYKDIAQLVLKKFVDSLWKK